MGRTPRPPSNKTLLDPIIHINTEKKSLSKHSSNQIAILRASSLQNVMQNIENHSLPPLLNLRTDTPPPPLFFLFFYFFIFFFFFFFLLFQKCVAVENKYSVLGLPGNKFPAEHVMKINNLSDQKCQPPPPPPQN